MMKRLLTVMLGAMVAFASCQKDAGIDGIENGAMVDVTISASMDVSTASTRATADYGDGTEVDRAILEVYLNGDLYQRISTPVEVGAMGASFDIRLVSSQDYEFVVWADHGDYASVYTEYSYPSDAYAAGSDADNFYNTASGLSAITMQGDYDCEDVEFRDAFYGYHKIEELTSAQSISMSLTRPFGQLNVLTNLTDVQAGFLPTEVYVAYSTNLPTVFNALTGATSTVESKSWVAAVEIIDLSSVETDATAVHLSTDYIFAPATGQDLHDFTMTFYNDGGEITSNDSFKNIPIQRNYRTNVSGELMTKGATITVTVTPTFTSTTDVEIQEAATVSELQSLLTDDATVSTTSYSVAETVTSTTSTTNITIPATTGSTEDTTSRSINFAGGIGSDTTVTITDANSGDETDSVTELYITVAEGSDASIEVYMPNSTVYINGTKVANVTGSASDDTIIIAADTEITDTLTVKQGNVKIYGKVNTIVVDSDNDAYGTITVCEGGVLTDIESSTTNKKNYTIIIESMDADDEDSFARAYTYAEAVNITTSFELSDPYTIEKAWTINGNENTITMSGSTQAQLSCNANLSLNSVTISHTANGYAIYVPEDSSATEINITNSTLTGYAAIYTKGDGAEYNIKGSTLNGVNKSTSPFAAICVADEATGNTLNIEGTKINTSQSVNLGYEYAIDIRENTGSTTVNLSNGTSFYYESNDIRSESRYYFIEHEVNNELRSTFTRDTSITYSSDMTDENMSLASGLLFGDGTEESPYEIYDNYDLKVVQFYTSTSTFAYFKQMQDIEYEYISAMYTGITPSPATIVTPSLIETSLTSSNMLVENFYGVYDGNGYAINNWGYNSTATGNSWGSSTNIGLFAYVYHGSTIKDLTLTCDDGWDGIKAIDEDKYLRGLTEVGAFAGSFGGTIENCVNYIPIDVYSTDSTCKVGGIFGRLTYGDDGSNFSTTEVKNCTNNASVTLTGSGSAAGIIGGGYSVYFRTVVEISNCTMTGDVTAPSAYGIYVEPVYEINWNNYMYLPNYYVDLDKNNECTGKVTSTSTDE